MRHDELYYEERNPSPLTQAWLDFKVQPLARAALYMLCFLLFISLFGPWLAPFGANEQFADALFLPPAWSNDGDLRFLLGTDTLGRDMISRILHGARYSFGLPLLIVCITGAIGITIGAMVAMSVGVASMSFQHILSALLSIPSLLLALIIIAVIGPGLFNAALAISLIFIPQFILVTRDVVLEELSKDYVVASRLNGVTSTYLFFSVILPNIVKPLVTQFSLALSAAILDIAALGFLGLGAQAPVPEWGAMLAVSLEYAYNTPWVMALPGLALFLTLGSVNIVGERLRATLRARMEH
ncbi:peptide ABC transporter permease [Aliidiomarina taiwanensis]|uniref:Peptide ABC transporter permease n=1 Tax=Aliidiomarina taiwanensis TaxID=946228 RepID=A0A432X9Y3_9GAMM|nr:ABC transporter permease subunit [Aliidiomarina taiwanensis]RUO44208.1 peptide ABC transporter permease [Aliidiomarina taiwanensis]